MGLLNRRMIRWSLLALAVGGLSLAWTEKNHYRFGGAWVGGHPGFSWNCLQIPLDPAGRTEAIRVDVLKWGADVAGLLSAFGADQLTSAIGEGRMISADTATWTLLAYAQASGNPPTTKAAILYPGSWTFTSQNTAEITYTVAVYPISADGYSPDLSAPPLYVSPEPITDTVKRVPTL